MKSSSGSLCEKSSFIMGDLLKVLEKQKQGEVEREKKAENDKIVDLKKEI